MILFLLHLPRNLDRILLFSGANNIILAFLNRPSPVYGALFNQNVIESSLKNPSGEYIGIRRAIAQLLKELRHRIITGSINHNLSVGTIDTDYQNILTRFQRDLHAFKMLANGLGARLYFALQPMATWIDKTLSPEEQKLFDILDSLQVKAWQVLSKEIGAVRDRYFNDMARICAEENIPFYNLNLDPAFRDATWLFVDRVHLTDRGNALAAEIVKREFKL